MSILERHRARYEADRSNARTKAVLNLQSTLRVDFNLSGWGGRAREAYADQWLNGEKYSPAGWDWEEIFRRHHEPDRLDIAIWGPQARLCGFGLALTTSQAITIRFVEGDSRHDCPLKGMRALIILECAACYAQARGRSELRIQPKNERLEELYRQIYGFVLETPRRGEAYYRKGI
jgi:hypothetical protein